jgi:hypothetical protein
MSQDDFTIRLTRDQALVWSDRLYRMIGTAEFDRLVDRDRAVWSPLYQIAGALETSLVEIFMPDYATRLDEARERLPGHSRRGGSAATTRSVICSRSPVTSTSTESLAVPGDLYLPASKDES